MFDNFVKNDTFFLIGIGGIGMSAIAKHLRRYNFAVSGSDIQANSQIDKLASAGIKVFISHKKENVCGSVVIYSDSIANNNPELVYAKKLGLKVFSRGEFLQLISEDFDNIIAISGSHGKTTATAMLAHIFDANGLPFTAFIGGEDLVYDNYYSSGNRYLIIEACEYKRNFLYLKPHLSVILNTELDHADCYDTQKEIDEAFCQFAQQSDNLISLHNSKDAFFKAKTFGYDIDSDIYATNVRCIKQKYFFDVFERGKKITDITLKIYGEHNILNALSVISVARHFSLNLEKTTIALNNFLGVRRRFESLGTFRGIECISDYAHHPTEIASSVKTMNIICNGELTVVFQPHTYTRTIALMRDFVAVFKDCKKLIIYKTYSAREKYIAEGSAEALAKKIDGCTYVDDEKELAKCLSKKSQKSKLVIFLGAGDIYDVANRIIRSKSSL